MQAKQFFSVLKEGRKHHFIEQTHFLHELCDVAFISVTKNPEWTINLKDKFARRIKDYGIEKSPGEYVASGPVVDAASKEAGILLCDLFTQKKRLEGRG